MPDLRQMRSRMQIAIAALVLVDVVAVALLMTPLAGSAEQRQQELQQSWLQLKSRESAPWRGLDQKIPIAQRQIEDFYRERFPAEDSTISADLGKVASETGVRMSAVKYAQKDAGLEGIERMEIEADVSGDYVQLVRFINALERNRLFFIVDDLELGNEQAGTVKLQIKVETYLRTL
jgi:Type II secretion system (T2SS), protein M subtype b